MPKAIQQTKTKLTFAYVKSAVPSIKQAVHDGDTFNVKPSGHLGVRFLGIDTPEISYTPPNETLFHAIKHEKWQQALANRDLVNYLPPKLQEYLAAKLTPVTAQNHYDYAEAAQRFLESQIQTDIEERHLTSEEAEFFLAFAYEVLDGYGRFLAYINIRQDESTSELPRPLDYNERLLEAGMAVPYFIWPNINPFRKATNLINAVPQPGTANTLATTDLKLSRARMWCQQNREEGRGLYNKTNPLLILPFELRFLAGQQQPSRFVIDLSKNDNKLLAPADYCQIVNPEDRLFIPPEFVPLFESIGWQRS